ncbi:MAG: glutamine ABC transporter ATP-binding protein [Verrucomicrobiia bacterium Tous-C2TDCM]|nr:MAG: glutamine ABC transporter ATP-binding protein [Verrucomicrobiae bacterium Tous-C2TDCM]
MSIEIRGLTKHYGTTRAADGIDLVLGDSVQVLALIGPSGGGKSTLLRLVGGLERPEEGTIRIDGAEMPRDEESLRLWRRQNGFLFQSFNLFPHLTALENIILPLVEVHGWKRGEADARAREVVARFGMGAHLEKHPAQLSGGQQQRIALARAMAHEPALLLLDEPTSALDPEMKAEVLDLIEELCQAGQRIILSTHEMGFARGSADAVVFLGAGRVVESGSAAELFDHPRSAIVQAFLSKVMKW